MGHDTSLCLKACYTCILNYNEGYNGGFLQLKYCSLWAIRISYLLHIVQKAICVVLRI